MFIIDSYFGFGDNIYHIPFVHKLAQKGKVFIYTPFPELFQFENVFCMRPVTDLKLQLQNMQGNGLYAPGVRPEGNKIRFNYGIDLKERTIIQSFESVIPLHGDFFFEYKPRQYKIVDDVMARVRLSGKKLCVIRLPSIRKEWPNINRNGKMEYFQTCIDALKDKYYFVSVGDIGNREEFDGVEPLGIDEKRDRHAVNHLGIWEVFDLINRSDLVLSIQCNALPMCQMLKKKGFFIYGGYVPHEPLNDSRFFQVGYVQPDPFCFCVNNGTTGHTCKKDIPIDKILLILNRTICS